MFEGIRFFEFEGEYGSGGTSAPQSSTGLWSGYDFAGVERTDYHVMGRLRFVLPLPLADERAERLVRLQSFSLMDTSSDYYTRREGYQSKLLLYTYGGAGCLRYGGREYELGPGDAFLIDCVQRHEYWTSGNSWSHADLHFTGGMVDLFYRESLAALPPVFCCNEPNRFQRELEGVLRANQAGSFDRDYRTSFELERLLFSVASWMGGEQGRGETCDPVQLLRAHLDCHYAERMSLDDMASFVGLSKYHLCRQFKRNVGMPPGEYVMQLRIQQAQQLLLATTIPCYRIGLLVGFRSEAGFISQFKRAMGMTPNAFRQGAGQI